MVFWKSKTKPHLTKIKIGLVLFLCLGWFFIQAVNTPMYDVAWISRRMLMYFVEESIILMKTLWIIGWKCILTLMNLWLFIELYWIKGGTIFHICRYNWKTNYINLGKNNKRRVDMVNKENTLLLMQYVVSS